MPQERVGISAMRLEPLLGMLAWRRVTGPTPPEAMDGRRRGR